MHVGVNVNSAVRRTQCQYYGHKRSRTTSITVFLASLFVFAGFEAGMIYAVRVSVSLFPKQSGLKLTLVSHKPSFNAGNMAPTMFFGIFSTVLIACGLL